MLQDIRRSTKGGWTYILVAILIVVFAVFFGVPGDACGSGASRKLVASVAGTDIYNDDINIVYNRSFGGQRRVDDSVLRQQQAQALRAMLLINILAEKAEDLGLRASDEEFREYVKDPLRNAEFRAVYGRDGKFDGPLYKAYVQNQLRMSLPRYEDFKKTELLAMKYLNLVEMQFQATPWEVEELAQLRGTEVNLEFAKFSPDQLAEFVPVTDEDVTAFVASDKKAIQAYYDENRSDYEEPAQVLIRRIYIVKPEEADKDAAKAAIERFDTAKARAVEKEENFADVAGELSESERETQGLMEWTTLENIDQNIATALKDAKVGEIKEVVTDYAFMLVKLDDRKEAKKTELVEVQNDIGRKLLQERKVEELVKAMVDELRAAAGSTETLQAAVESLKANTVEGEKSPWEGVTVDTTGEFTQEGQDLAALFGGQFPGMSQRAPWDRVPKIGKNPELARDAFAKLTKEKPLAERPYKADGNYFVVRLQERTETPAEEMKKEEVKFLTEARGAKMQSMLGPYSALFAFPLDDYGPFLEGILESALESGMVKLYEKNYDAIPLLQPEKKEEKKEVIDLTKKAEG